MHAMVSTPSQEQAGSWAGRTALQWRPSLFTYPPTVNGSPLVLTNIGTILRGVDGGAEATGADETVPHSSPFLSFPCSHGGVIGLVLADEQRHSEVTVLSLALSLSLFSSAMLTLETTNCK